MKYALAAFAATLLLAGAAASAAPATTADMPVATAPAIRLAAIVCGGNGCTPVHTHQQNAKRKFQTLGHG